MTGTHLKPTTQPYLLNDPQQIHQIHHLRAERRLVEWQPCSPDDPATCWSVQDEYDNEQTLYWAIAEHGDIIATNRMLLLHDANHLPSQANALTGQLPANGPYAFVDEILVKPNISEWDLHHLLDNAVINAAQLLGSSCVIMRVNCSMQRLQQLTDKGFRIITALEVAGDKLMHPTLLIKRFV